MSEPSDYAAQLQRLRKLGGEAFVQKMLVLFLQTAPPRVEAVRRAVEAGDWPGVEHAAHSLKSSAGNIGAERVRELADQMEQRADAGKTDGLAALAAELSEALDQAVGCLHQFLKSDVP